MEHKSQLENKKYRNWVKAGLGIKYVKDGLEPFCEHLVTQQHTNILNRVKQKHSQSDVSCGLCDIRTLQPDHVRTRSRQCPLGQIHCNCQYPGGKNSCPNNVCGAIYDEIILLHASTPPAPYWRNTDAQQWCTESWSVAKCFINAPGYEQKTIAAEFDCPGLLHVLMNNMEFQHHIKCNITGTDVFSRVLKSRNEIFHSHTMELEDADVNSYIDDMIELLEDETEIKNRQESKDAVKNLLQLKQENFIISTTDEEEIRRVAMTAINEKEAELKQIIDDAGNELETKTAEGKHELEGNFLAIKSKLEKTGQKIRKEMVEQYDEIRTTAAECKHDIEGKGLIIKAELEQKRIELENKLTMKEGEAEDKLEQKFQESKLQLEMKQEDFIISTTDEAENSRDTISVTNEKEPELKKKIVDDGNELESKTAERKHELEGKSLATKYGLEQTGQKKLHLENTKTLIEDSTKGNAETKHQAENNIKTSDFQAKLIKRYEKYVRKVPSLPLQPKRNQRNVSDVYVPPWMTVRIKNEDAIEGKEVKISLHEIFRNDDNTANYIYVIGEAGSGKSMFCKVLVHFWCIAHSCVECSVDQSDIVKEMGRFKYLFYVSLRHCSDCDSIERMLKKSYHDPALGDILQNESDQCLIVLDGLDEWTPEKKHNSQFLTPGLPERELDANYTIITTSRQWKFDALPITENEVDKKIKLRGIDKNGIKDVTEKTVKMLNDTFCKSKSAENCKLDLQGRPVSDIIHIPLILQQLTLLWFDEKLLENSRCAIYSSMLALFLEWKSLKYSETQECDEIIQEYSPLPGYLCQFDTFCENTRVIHYLSHLAYETLFDKNKETTLTFSRSTLKRLNIPNDVIKFCLNAGILAAEENITLHASMSQQSSFSFFHKSIQDYLAAVYVASQFKEMVNSQKSLQRNEREHTDVCKKCVLKYFGSCETVVDILEQSNVIIILCGLEPLLLTNVSELIFNIAALDRMVVEERRVPKQFFREHNKLIKDSQACISRCIEEVIAREKNVHAPVYIADLYVFPSTKLLLYCKKIVLQKVLSVEVEEREFDITEPNKEAFHLILERLTECDQLKAIRVNGKYSDSSDGRIINALAKILRANVSTIETISFLVTDKNIIPLLVAIVPGMRNLVSLQIMNNSLSDLSHEVCLSLNEILNQTISLQHISLGIHCEKHDQHLIDLSKHKRLQHVDIGFSAFYILSCNTDNLETCKLYASDSAMMNQLCNTLYETRKLKQLCLNGIMIIEQSLADYRTVTEDIIRLLPSLVSLSTLTLRHFTFTDHIITCPSDMKNLNEIELYSTIMRMTTWCKFIDSLPALPQSVRVKIYQMLIIDESIAGLILRNEKRVEDARQYVREKTNLFRVSRDYTDEFWFTTKKV